ERASRQELAVKFLQHLEPRIRRRSRRRLCFLLLGFVLLFVLVLPLILLLLFGLLRLLLCAGLGGRLRFLRLGLRIPRRTWLVRLGSLLGLGLAFFQFLIAVLVRPFLVLSRLLTHRSNPAFNQQIESMENRRLGSRRRPHLLKGDNSVS